MRTSLDENFEVSRTQRVSSASPLGKLGGVVVALVISWQCAGTAFALADADLRWVPPNEETLQSIADAIEQARLGQDEPALREGILRFADALMSEAQTSALALAPTRWLGAGEYLQELLSLIDPKMRSGIVADIDTRLRAQLLTLFTNEVFTNDGARPNERRGAERSSGLSLPMRLARDFPFSELAPEYQRLAAELLLEVGATERTLTLASRSPTNEDLARALDAFVGLAPAPTATASRAVFENQARLRWSGHVQPASPWADVAVRRVPRVDGELVFVNDARELYCVDAPLAQVRWRKSLAPSSDTSIPGAEYQPLVMGETVIVATPARLSAFQRLDGEPRWSFALRELFESPADIDPTATEETAKDTEQTGQILAISPPIACPWGVLVAVLELRGQNLRGQLALISERGELRWNRPVGSAAGATFLGLGMARPALVSDGDAVYLLTQRGLLSCHDVLDGAARWAVEYESFDARASRDALALTERFRNPFLALTGNFLFGAPADAAGLCVWRKNGELVARTPRGDADWWTLLPARSRAADAAPGVETNEQIALVAPHRVVLGEWRATRLETIAERALPATSPAMTGPALAVGTDWWVPAAGGFYVMSASLDQFAFRPLDRQANYDAFAITPNLLLASSGNASTLYKVVPNDALSLASDRSFRLRSALSRGDDDGLLRALQEWPQLENESTLDHAERRRLGEEILLRFDADLRDGDAAPRDATARAELVQQTLRLLPTSAFGDLRFELATLLARGGELDLAIEVAYLALELPPGALTTLEGTLEVSSTLAVRRLIQELRARAPQSAANASIEERAQKMRAALPPSPTAESLKNIVEHFPFTRTGRAALLELAQLYRANGRQDLALELLATLILTEPSAVESRAARLEAGEICVRQQRLAAARAYLTPLVGDPTNAGGGETTTPDSEQMATRARELLASIETLAAQSEEPPRRSALPFSPVWRTRTEMRYQRNVEVIPLAPAKTGFLLQAQRTLGRYDARTGATVWVAHVAPASANPGGSEAAGGEGVEADTNGDFGADEFDSQLRPPLAVLEDRVLLLDDSQMLAIDLATGLELWRVSLPVATSIPNDPQAARLSETIFIEKAVAAGDFAVCFGADHVLYGFDTLRGGLLWQSESLGPLSGDPQIFANQVLTAFPLTRKLEVRELATGNVVRTHIIPDDTGRDSAFLHAPFFLDAETAIVCDQRHVQAVRLTDGEPIWTFRVPGGQLHRVYPLRGAPFLVVEAEADPSGPVLHGISATSGRRLWRKSTGTVHRNLEQLELLDGDLYLLLSSFNSHEIVKFDLPPAFLVEQDLEELPSASLEIEWSQNLGRQWDQYRILEFGAWIILYGEFKADFTVLSKEGGLPVEGSPFALAQDFLRLRRQLFFAGFIDETLVLSTAHGAIGMRQLEALDLVRSQWSVLSNYDPVQETALASSGPVGPVATTVPDLFAPLAAQTAFVSGQVGDACTLLERALSSPRLSNNARRGLRATLEGMSQQYFEARPLEWTVPLANQAPVIDGHLDEPWQAASAHRFASARFLHPVQGEQEDPLAWRDARDLSATLFTCWSDEGFHLAVDVSDDRQTPYDRSAKRWIGDCLLLAFDFKGNGGSGPGRDDQLLTLSLTVPKPVPPPVAGAGADGQGEKADEPEDKPEGKFQVLRRSEGGGVVYEATIPWETFRTSRADPNRPEPNLPFPGMSFRLNVVLTDDDTGDGARSYLSLSPGQMLEERPDYWRVFIPEHFPRVTLGQ
ncbi:MAG: PQQ-binding-like beta-propeller repeat protein [Planctomycetota bacterium]